MARKQNQKTSGGQDKNQKKSQNRKQAETPLKKQEQGHSLSGDGLEEFDSVLPSYGSFLKDMQYEDDWGDDWDDDDTPIEKKVADLRAEKAKAKKKKQSRTKKPNEQRDREKKRPDSSKAPVHEDERLFDGDNDRGLTLDEFETVGARNDKRKQPVGGKKTDTRSTDQAASKPGKKSAKPAPQGKIANREPKPPAAKTPEKRDVKSETVPNDMQAVSKGGGVSLRIDASKNVSRGSTRRKRAVAVAPEDNERSTQKSGVRDANPRHVKKTPEPPKATPGKPGDQKKKATDSRTSSDETEKRPQKQDATEKTDRSKEKEPVIADAPKQAATGKKKSKHSAVADTPKTVSRDSVKTRDDAETTDRRQNRNKPPRPAPERDAPVTTGKQAVEKQTVDKRALPEKKGVKTDSASGTRHEPSGEKSGESKKKRDKGSRRAAAEQTDIAAIAAETEGKDEPTAFGNMKLSKVMLESLKAANYREPSPVQAGVIPVVLAGHDVMGQARTGTGKTAAFVIPILEGLDECDPGDEPAALILVPTRELAVQVRDEAEKLSKGRKVRTIACYGGKPIGQQIVKLKKGVDIVVGTPGRVLDLSRRGALTLDSLIWVVLDEADRMLDIGFRPDIEKILRLTPSDRQTLLLSATLPPEVVKLAERYMKNPKVIDFSDKQMAVETIDQYYITIDRDRKLDGLICLIKEQNPKQAIVFCRTKRGADRVKRQLEGTFKSLESLHGDMTQGIRDRVMSQFRAGKVQILVATDVVGRGIDISGISHIINYDIPQFCDDYVHRVGRTGRMGREGTAFTFVTAEEGQELTRIEMRINRLLKRAELKDFEAVSQIVPQEKEAPKPVFGKPTHRVRRAL